MIYYDILACILAIYRLKDMLKRVDETLALRRLQGPLLKMRCGSEHLLVDLVVMMASELFLMACLELERGERC